VGLKETVLQFARVSPMRWEFRGEPMRVEPRTFLRIPYDGSVKATDPAGSEVTLWAVVTDPARHMKLHVGGTGLIAAPAALLDPELMLEVPAGSPWRLAWTFWHMPSNASHATTTSR